MAEVANPKLVDLAPTWRRYVGWTVLFCPDVRGSSNLYSVSDESPGNRECYGALARWFETVDLPDFAALPPDTYHVTVCDGLSPMHDGRLDDRWRRRVHRRLRRLPGSLVRLDRPTMGHERDVLALVESCRREARFAVSGVELRGTAVVATLTPLDDDGWFDEISAVRTALLDALGATVHATLSSVWRPHVTLAYAANSAAAKALADQVGSVGDDAVTATAGGSLRFASADVFAFDDMVTFHRRPA